MSEGFELLSEEKATFLVSKLFVNSEFEGRCIGGATGNGAGKSFYLLSGKELACRG